MKNKMNCICHIYGFPSHYRSNIYRKLDNCYNSWFYFGDEPLKIKKLDLSQLKNASILHTSFWGKTAMQWGILKLPFMNYDKYVLTASTNNLATWLLMMMLKFFPKKKIYLWHHGLYGYENSKQLLIRKLYFRLSDGMFLYGDWAKELIIKEGILPESKLHVIHNSLDYETQLSIRNNLSPIDIYKQHFHNSNPVLIFIGRLTKVKKLDLLILALNELNKQNFFVNLILVGDGQEREYIESLIKQYNLKDQVWIYGACYDELENAKLIYNADVCVSPGNVGLTAMHSMMFGTPVLTHNNYQWQMPEFESIKVGKTGDFFTQGNIESMSYVIKEWLRNNSRCRNDIRNYCFKEIDNYWTPEYQMTIFKQVLGA